MADVSTSAGHGPPPEWPVDADDFAAYYAMAPAALAVRECARLRAVRRYDLAEPILDVGCGDGLFARLAHPRRTIWGVDINPTEVQRAQSTATYNTLICGNISQVDLPPAFFGGAIANCSLEHVADLHAALVNIGRALRSGGKLLLIVPTPEWTRNLLAVELLRNVGLLGLARAYGDTLDRVFAHLHLYDEPTWRLHLERAGFETLETVPVAARSTSWVFDLLLPPSLVGLLVKKLTGRWIMVPTTRVLSVDLVRAAANLVSKLAPQGSTASEYLFVCRRREPL